MRFGDERESTNFTDDTGRGGLGLGGGGFGGGGLGCLLPLIASRFGIGGVVVLVIGYFLLSSLGGLGGGGSGGVIPATQQGASAGQSTLDPNAKHFSLQVLASTEDVWGQLLKKNGAGYTPTNLHFYSESDQSGCGAAQSAMGPFYCPTDKNIYLDTQFFNELSQRFQAPGDFAQAYVIAHEVAHHVQALTGVTEQVTAAASEEPSLANELSILLELQADCLAGVWAHTTYERGLLERGDLEEGLAAAAAVGDDRIQAHTTGRIDRETWTHGSSEQRVSWFVRGFESGRPADCDTFEEGPP
jgi:predicted metalloprotease